MRFAIFAAAVVLSACAAAPRGAIVVDAPSSIPSIQHRMREQLATLETGMSLADFRKKVPAAYVAGQNGGVTAYEVVDIQSYVTQGEIDRAQYDGRPGNPPAHVSRQELWFYFHEDRLVRWGRPQDWPTPADLVIERRQR